MTREPPRLLAARSQYGYTSRSSEALPAEPEAVSAAEQAELTRQARLDAAARTRELLVEVTSNIEAELVRLDGVTGVGSTVRAMRRQLIQLSSKVQR